MGVLPAVCDPRLSEAGNQVWKRVAMLLDVLGHMAGTPWAHGADAGGSRELPRFQKLARDAGSVAALSRSFVGELERTCRIDAQRIVRSHYGGASQQRIAEIADYVPAVKQRGWTSSSN
jgi:hypothetical protein